MARTHDEGTPFPNTGSEEIPPGATGKAADRTIERPLTEGRNLTRLTGFRAIEHAEKLGLTLNKHPDRIDGPRQRLTVAEALAVAAEDPALIWLDVDEDEAQEAVTNFEPGR